MASLFSLEALQAEEGDSLLLHFGSEAEPRVLLIDGGPRGVYEATLRPRLEALRPDDGPLPLPIVMVSHIDDDHICGVLALVRELAAGGGEDPIARIGTLWHNSFAHVVPTEVHEGTDRPATSSLAAAVLAGVPQANELSEKAGTLGIDVNHGFGGMVMAKADGPRVAEVGDVRLSVIGPDKGLLDALEEVWRQKSPGERAEPSELAAYRDRRAENLSSIVVLVECEERRILTTGDARGDNVMRAADLAGIEATFDHPLDVFKVPHHGSDANIKVETFERLPARHYVFSANGKDHNPDVATLEMLSKAREGHDDFTVWLTNREMRLGQGEAVARHFEAEKAAGRTYDVCFRDDDAPSLVIDLLDDPAPR